MDWATLQARFAAFAATVWGWLRAGIKLLTALIGFALTVAIAHRQFTCAPWLPLHCTIRAAWPITAPITEC